MTEEEEDSIKRIALNCFICDEEGADMECACCRKPFHAFCCNYDAPLAHGVPYCNDCRGPLRLRPDDLAGQDAEFEKVRSFLERSRKWCGSPCLGLEEGFESLWRLWPGSCHTYEEFVSALAVAAMSLADSVLIVHQLGYVVQKPRLLGRLPHLMGLFLEALTGKLFPKGALRVLVYELSQQKGQEEPTCVAQYGLESSTTTLYLLRWNVKVMDRYEIMMKKRHKRQKTKK